MEAYFAYHKKPHSKYMTVSQYNAKFNTDLPGDAEYDTAFKKAYTQARKAAGPDEFIKHIGMGHIQFVKFYDKDEAFYGDRRIKVLTNSGGEEGGHIKSYEFTDTDETGEFVEKNDSRNVRKIFKYTTGRMKGKRMRLKDEVDYTIESGTRRAKIAKFVGNLTIGVQFNDPDTQEYQTDIAKLRDLGLPRLENRFTFISRPVSYDDSDEDEVEDDTSVVEGEGNLLASIGSAVGTVLKTGGSALKKGAEAARQYVSPRGVKQRRAKGYNLGDLSDSDEDSYSDEEDNIEDIASGDLQMEDSDDDSALIAQLELVTEELNKCKEEMEKTKKRADKYEKRSNNRTAKIQELNEQLAQAEAECNERLKKLVNLDRAKLANKNAELVEQTTRADDAEKALDQVRRTKKIIEQGRKADMQKLKEEIQNLQGAIIELKKATGPQPPDIEDRLEDKDLPEAELKMVRSALMMVYAENKTPGLQDYIEINIGRLYDEYKNKQTAVK